MQRRCRFGCIFCPFPVIPKQGTACLHNTCVSVGTALNNALLHLLASCAAAAAACAAGYGSFVPTWTDASYPVKPPACQVQRKGLSDAGAAAEPASTILCNRTRRL
jgi:hypothetical protein